MHSGRNDPEGSGCPIRTSQDHSSVTSSSGLIAGSHVLHRLSTPRHPPCALIDLVTPTRTRWRSPSGRTDQPAGADMPRHAPPRPRHGASRRAVAQTLTISLSVLDHAATMTRPGVRPPCRASSQHHLTHTSQLVKELPETALAHAPRPKNERRGERPPRQVQPGRIAVRPCLSTCAAPFAPI